MVIQISSSAQKLSSLGSPQADLFESPWGLILDRLFCFRVIDAQDRLVVVFLYGGNIPFVVSLCFASQRTPTACPCCAGSISTIGLRSFLLKVSGSNSLLSFCCTSLVSGLIIQEDARFVYWQTAQRMDFVFVQC